jgi:hypothetical protein
MRGEKIYEYDLDCENVSLTRAADKYARLNTRQVWGFGAVNFAAGKIHIDAYMQ